MRKFLDPPKIGNVIVESTKKLFVSNTPYYLNRSQRDGEEDLANIAKKAKRENSSFRIL